MEERRSGFPIFEKSAHALAQRILAEQIRGKVVVNGVDAIDSNAQKVLFLYNHATRKDTAALAHVGNLTNRLLVNLVRPHENWKGAFRQYVNPTSHVIYPVNSIQQSDERDRMNQESIFALRERIGTLGKSAISLAPDGGTSTPFVEPMNVKTRGIQMIMETFEKDGIAVHPVGLDYNHGRTCIQIGSDMGPEVFAFTSLFLQYKGDQNAIHEINTSFKDYIAATINSQIPTEV